MRLMKPGVSLYAHQKLGRRFILRRKYVLLGDEMGLGKSLQAIAAMVETEGLALVICPAFLRNNWKAEIEKFTNLSSRIVTAKEKYDSVPSVIISSYENVKNIPKELEFNFVVLDESHYIKNIKAKRTQSVISLISDCRPDYVVALSGTPILNGVTEFYVILKLLSLCPSGTNGVPIKEKSQYGFSIKFSNQSTRNIRVKTRNQRTSTVKISDFSGVKNLDTLKMYLKGKYMRRLASKVLDLPRVTDVPLIVAETHDSVSSQLETQYQKWLEAGGGLLTDHITHLKIANAMSKVIYTAQRAMDIIDSGEQVVIFSDNRDPVFEIHKALKKKNLRVEMLIGGQSSGVRQAIVDRFQAKKLDAVVCTVGAASTGITLTSANQMIINDQSWVPANMMQARKRIDRISQKRPVTITTIINGDFDLRLHKKLEDKMKEISEVVSNG